jgi:hypothetical protein
LPARDEAWQALRCCVDEGRFTALRVLLAGAWDQPLGTRVEAPALLARVIAERGGDVDADLALLHEHRIPLFTLAQALARPDRLRGALVILRARVTGGGVVEERRLVGHSEVIPLEPWERMRSVRQSYNLDIATGHRALARLDADPFLDLGESLVVLARFDGLRSGDLWPELTVLAHFRPSETLTY